MIMEWRAPCADLAVRSRSCSLVSSFLTTIFCADGEIKPMEESDACGANLWSEWPVHAQSRLLRIIIPLTRRLTYPADLKADGRWDSELLEYVAGGKAEAAELERKLGQVEKDGGVAAGKIGRWFVERYGMDPGA